MKKQTIPTLGRIIGKAVIAATLACPIFFSSCESFDDSELKSSIQDLYDKISALEERVTNEVAALTSLINGKVTVVDVTTAENGVTTIAFSDNSVVKVYPETDLSSLSFVTVKEEGGVYYWATAGYGSEPEFLLVNGEKVPVKEDVKPTFSLKDGYWQISFDGGKTWTDTGIAQPEGNDNQSLVVFAGYTQDDDYVYLTLADEAGTVIKVAKDKEVSFSILAGKQYFTFGEKKAIPLQMTNVKDYTITEKPDGWKASINGSKLSVTAPAEGTDADTEGFIKVLATFENESPVIAKVSVSLDEPDFTLTLDGANVSFTLAEKNVDNYDYYGYAFGVLPKSEYSAEAAIEYLNATFRWAGTQYYESYSTTIEELAGDAYDPTESYVVFASNWYSPYDEETYSAEELQYVVYTPIGINVEIVPSLDNAMVSVSFFGCEGFYAGCDEKAYWDPENYLYGLGATYGPELCTTEYNGPAGLICGGYSQYLKKGTDYVFWVVPYDESGNYTVESFITYEFSTKSLSLGGDLAAPVIELTQEPTFDQVAIKVKTVPGAYKTYAKIFTLDEIPEDELEFVNLITKGASAGSDKENFQTNRTSLQPGTPVVAAAVAIDADGKAGAVTRFETSTKALKYNESLKVTAEAINVGMTSADVKLTFEGTATEVKYWCNSYELNDAENTLVTSTYYGTKVAVSDLTDNTLSFTNLTLGSTYYFYVIAYDADGLMSHMATTTFVPSSDIVYIKKSKDNWAFGQPSISNEVWGEDPWIYRNNSWNPGWHASSTTLAVDLTMGENCKKAYVLFTEPDSHSTKTEITMSDWVVAKGTEFTASGVASYDYANPATHIYVVWVDSNDEYHTYYEYAPTYPPMPTEPPTGSGDDSGIF